MSNNQAIFSSPKEIRVKRGFSNGVNSFEMIFEEAVKFPGSVKGEELGCLMKEVEYFEGNIKFEGESYRVDIDKNNLVIKNLDGEFEKAGYLKSYISYRIKAYELEFSDATTLARKLLDIMNSYEFILNVSEEAFSSFSHGENISPNFLVELKRKIHEKIPEVMEKLSDLYLKYYTRDELLRLIEFYQSDLGKKMVQVSPQVSHESIRIGQEWSREIVGEIEKEAKLNSLA